MEFLFSPSLEAGQLLQGDLLIRNDAVSNVLSEAHQYYAQAEGYRHFVVITQSCDLVRRGRKPPKAPYITIAAVRPFEIVLSRYLKQLEYEFDGKPTGHFDQLKRMQAEQFLERMLNNEEKNFFFLRQGSHPSVKEDLCAFLQLSVALRASHYDALLGAKVAQLDDIFSAKLGSMVAAMYSRVATPDISEKMASPEEYKAAFFDEKLGTDGRWVSTTRWNSARGKLKAAYRGRLEEVDETTISRAVELEQEDVYFLADRVVEILNEHGISIVDVPAFRNRLANDTRLRKVAKAIP